MRGRALQEWNLLGPTKKTSYPVAVGSLRSHLDPGSRTLAAQEFRHAIQGKDEKVADYIRRLEKAFQVAYGRDDFGHETMQGWRS